MPKALSYLETLVQETQKTEAEVVAMAFETGLRQLWRERVLGRYLRGEIARGEAIESAGIDCVCANCWASAWSRGPHPVDIGPFLASENLGHFDRGEPERLGLFAGYMIARCSSTKWYVAGFL